jgi:hypothetical protein
MTDTENQFLALGVILGAGISTFICIAVVTTLTVLRIRREKKNAMLTPLIGVVLPKGHN